MKVLFLWLDISEMGRPSFNHGLAYLAGFLKKNGHEVGCFHVQRIGKIESLTKVIGQERYDCIAISLVTNQRKYLDVCTESLRKVYSGLLIAGGVHATLDPEDVLKCEHIDGVCIGEGELPFKDLADRYDKKMDYRSVPCFWWKERGQKRTERIIRNKVNPFVSDLSGFPFPDYSIFDVESIVNNASGFFDIIISRGCPFSCTYCCNNCIRSAYPSSQGYFRIYSPEEAVDILSYYKEVYLIIKGFNFADDLLVWKKEWFLSFASKYRERIGLPYTCNCRFEIMDEQIASALSESGCVQVNFGLESGDEDLRKRLLKRSYTNEQIIKCAELLHRERIPFFTYNIFGFPFETREQMQETVAINKAIRPSSGGAFFFFPFPKTELHDVCTKNDLFLKEKMQSVDGYCESPVIQLFDCEESECVSLQQELTLYFAVRRLCRLLRINNEILETGMHKILLLRPSFFMKLLFRDGRLKRGLRRLMYFAMRHKDSKVGEQKIPSCLSS